MWGIGMEYLIGFYNDIIDNKDELEKLCKITFNDFNKLKNHLRDNDTVVVNDFISLYGISIEELLHLKTELNLTIITIDEIGKNIAQSTKDFIFTTTIGFMDYIYKNENKIKKLI